MSKLPYCVRPCANCPWRRDSAAGEFPVERYEALRATAGVPGQESRTRCANVCLPQIGTGDRVCAGWLAIAGTDHLGIRLAVALGRLPASVLQAREGWPDLFGSYGEMAERNGAKSADAP
ncbi:DUF6283 family protein [Mycobacterium avium]|uniref:DUF6283 family protein n=1 Tax=Mycobacterium avium TaxID=1764 RepID=UPI0034A10CB4